MPNFSNPNGESLVMDLPVKPRTNVPFWMSNYPIQEQI